MERNDIQNYFKTILKEDEDVSTALAAMKTLLAVVEKDKYETVQELDGSLKAAIDVMKNSDHPVTSIVSGSELFLRFITFAQLDTKFEECREIMINRGHLVLKTFSQARKKIVNEASSFITDGSKILTHSRSRVVLHTLKEAAKSKNFEVFVTESTADNSGKRMLSDLRKAGIPCTLILDSAIGYIMEQVNFVMVGAEGVVESGGIINKIGSYTIALCAKEMKRPFYVLTESFKFTRLYPLNQVDLPREFKYTAEALAKKDLSKEHPLVDYTPPAYVTLLFTDLGILTPSAVSDQLIELYL